MATRKKAPTAPVKIESLTDAQKAKLPIYAREWTDIGLCTEPADRPRAERAINLIYGCGGLQPPQRIVWCGSPLALVKRQALSTELAEQAVQDRTSNSRATAPAHAGECIYGQHDANWLAFYAFMRDELGLLAQTEKLAGLTELCKSAGWALPYEHTCYVAERHHTVKKDNAGRLHCLDGAAVEYPDGWGVYAVRGTRVPNEWVLNRATLDPKIALTERNMDLRSAAALLIGWERVLAQLAPKVIDSEMGIQTAHGYCMGELLEIDLPDEPGQKFLRVMWGKEQQAVLRVPPNMRTAREANQWTHPLPFAGEFKPEGRT